MNDSLFRSRSCESSALTGRYHKYAQHQRGTEISELLYSQMNFYWCLCDERYHDAFIYTSLCTDATITSIRIIHMNFRLHWHIFGCGWRGRERESGNADIGQNTANYYRGKLLFARRCLALKKY